MPGLARPLSPQVSARVPPAGRPSFPADGTAALFPLTGPELWVLGPRTSFPLRVTPRAPERGRRACAARARGPAALAGGATGGMRVGLMPYGSSLRRTGRHLLRTAWALGGAILGLGQRFAQLTGERSGISHYSVQIR